MQIEAFSVSVCLFHWLGPFLFLAHSVFISIWLLVDTQSWFLRYQLPLIAKNEDNQYRWLPPGSETLASTLLLPAFLVKGVKCFQKAELHQTVMISLARLLQ